MNLTEKVQAKFRTKGGDVSLETITLITTKRKPISEEKREMTNPTLRHEIKRLGTQFYNRDIEDNIQNEFASHIRKKYGQLGIVEVIHCISEAIENRTELEKFFSLSAVYKIFENYVRFKSRLMVVYFDELRNHTRDEQAAKDASEFKIESIRKWRAKERLTVYEKSIIGRAYAFENPEADSILERAKEDLPLKEKMLRVLQEEKCQPKNDKLLEKTQKGFFLDPEIDLPVFWTLDLLYGLYLFESLKS